MSLDIASLLQEIDPEAPCGPDLSDTAEFMELERLMEGTTEQVVGDSVIPAADPEWREVRERSLKLLEQSRDLRVIVFLCVAAMKLEGLPGLRDGLALLEGSLRQFWDHIHPQLDPDDDNDPLERMNILGSLAVAPGGYRDPIAFLQRLREVPLCKSRQLGAYSLRDILLASGQLSPGEGDEERPDSSVIQAAMTQTDPDEMAATRQAAAEAQELTGALNSLLTETVGAGQAPNLQPLVEMLEVIGKHVGTADSIAAGEVAEESAAGETVDPAVPADAAAAPAAPPGTVNSRADVVKTLDRICEYYRRHEPSSPVPLLLHRARRLVDKDFVEIIRDLAPDGVTQIETIGGLESGSEY